MRPLIRTALWFALSASLVTLVAVGCDFLPLPESRQLATSPTHQLGDAVLAQESEALIDLEKLTNGQDVDSPPGPVIPAGADVSWSYVVTNTGQVALTEVAVTDDQGVAVTCPKTELQPGESMTCTAAGVAVAGPYTNIGTAQGMAPDGSAVSDSDTSYYFGQEEPPPAPTCDAGGPYTAECLGADVTIPLDAGNSTAPPGAALLYAWSTDCPGGTFDDPTSPTPTLTIPATSECPVPCKVILRVSDGTQTPVACEAPVTVTDTAPPTFTTLAQDTSLECGSDYADALKEWLATPAADDACTEATITNDFNGLSDDCGATGSAMVTWTAQDACGLTATTSATFSIVDTTPPVIELIGEPAVTLECGSVYTDAGASAADTCDDALSAATVGGDAVDVRMPGTYVVAYDATDACGNAAAQVTRTVEVVDTTPPDVIVGDPILLWPPNHEYRTLSLSDCVETVEDACGAPVDVNTAGAIVSIYSDEPDDETGNGDGHTTADIVILGPSQFKVRAERAGHGNGRVYGISFTLSDAAGNATEATCLVGVPHDQSGDMPVDDGPDAGQTVVP